MDTPANQTRFCNLTEFNKTYQEFHGYASLVVCVLGSVANSLNIAVLSRKEMRSPTNLILTGLAIADLLVMVEYIPFAFYTYIDPTNKHSYEVALLIFFHSNFAQVFHTASIFLTVTLAVWRYIAIAHPQFNRIWLNMKMTVISIIGVFLASALICIPTYLAFGINEYPVPNNHSAGNDTNHTKVLYAMGMTKLAIANGNVLLRVNFWMYSVFMKLIPCVLLTVLSLRLICALMKAKERRQQLTNSNNLLKGDQRESRPSVKKSKKLAVKEKQADRTTRMLLVVLLLFLITEFPQGILGLLAAFLGDRFLKECYSKLGEFMDFLALINSGINFMIYCSMSRQFRITFSLLFKPNILNKWLPVSRLPAADTDTTCVTQV